MQKFKNIFKSSKPKPNEPVTPSKDQQLQQALFTLLAWRDFSQQTLSNQLTSLTDQLLWADKNSPEVMLKVIQSQLFDFTLLHIFSEHQIPVLQISTLLLTNLRNPQTVNYLMGCKLSQMIIATRAEDEQAESYLMGWLKAYSQRVTKNNVSTMVDGNRCLLLEKCAEYSKSDDSMTRTTTLNIIINLIKGDFEELKPCLAGESFTIFYVHLCEYFNELLKEIDQFLLGLTESKVGAFNKMLDDLDDLLLFFDDLSGVQDKNLTFILGTVIYQSIILPSLLSSMRLKDKGLISINLATYVIIRMTRLLQNLGIINLVVRLMFAENASADYWVDLKSTSDEQKISNMKKLLAGEKIQHENTLTVSGIRESMFMFFRSKDDNLNYLMSSLLLNILRSKFISKEVRLECGLNMRGEDVMTRNTRKQLLEVLSNQLSAHFRIITMKNISALLVELAMVGNEFELSSIAQTNLLDVYQKQIVEVKHALRDNNQYDKITEYFETDCKYVSQKLLDMPHSVGKQAFTIPDYQDERLGFYERAPCNHDQIVRRSLIIFCITRKLRYMTIKQSKLSNDEHNLQKLYNSKLKSDVSNYRPGQSYKIEGKMMYPCIIEGEGARVPSYIIDDQLNFITGFAQHGNLRIFLNMKFKHINPIVNHRDINKITIKLRGYDQSKQVFTNKDSIFIECSDNYMAQRINSYFIAKKNLSRQAELAFVLKLVTNSEKDLPEVNLIDL